MSLLDYFSNNKDENSGILSNALLQLAAGLLTPQSRGGGFGPALAGFNQSIAQSEDQKLKRQLQAAQLSDIQAQAQLRKQQSDVESQRNDLIRQLTQPQGPSAPQAALSAGAAVGDVGPTPTNAVRIPQMPQQQSRLSLMSPDQLLALSSMKGFEKAPEIYRMAQEGFEIKPGTWRKMPDGSVKWIADVKQDASGNTTVIGTDPTTGEFAVTVPKGATNAIITQTLARNLANAATSLEKVQGPQGEPRLMSNLQALMQGGALENLPMLQGQQPSIQMPNKRAQAPGSGYMSVPDQLAGVMNYSNQAPASQTADISGFNPVPGAAGIQSGPNLRQSSALKNVGEEDAKFVGAVPQKQVALQGSLRSLNLLKDLNGQDKTYAGLGAETKVQLINGLKSIGIPVDVTKAANTELFVTRVAELLKERLASKDYGSGTGISNLDLATAGRPLPEVAKTREGRALIIDALSKDINQAYQNLSSAKSHFELNGSLQGFNFPLSNTPNDPASMARAELARRRGAQ